jgi:hypothetical protein
MTTATAEMFMRQRDEAIQERDRLRAAIERHAARIVMGTGPRPGLSANDADEALWAALDPSPSPEPPEAA